MVNITYMKTLNSCIIMLLLLLNLEGFAQGPAVFTCDGTALYQTISIEENIPGVGSQGDFIFYSVNPSTGEFTFVNNLSVDDDGGADGDTAISGNINSIGFNPIDGFIYGISTNLTPILYKISPNGYVQNLGNISGPLANVSGKQAGVIDQNGIYYVTGSSQKLYSIDLSSSPSPGDIITSTFLFNTGKATSDIAINPINNLIYGWDEGTKRQLFTINTNNGDISVIGPAEATSQYRVFGALYFTAGGQLIGYGDDANINGFNTQETLVQINVDTGIPSFIATGESVNSNDGTSCPYGLELFKAAPENVSLGEEFTYTFTIYNASGVPLTNLEFIDNLIDGIIFTTDPFNITNNLQIIGSTEGLTSANLTINEVPIGFSSFQINVTTDCSTENMVISNQATLSSDVLTVTSDDPQMAGVTNTTITDIQDPTINVPDPLVIEGCDLNVINEDNALFPFTTTQSNDIKDIFNTVSDYTTTAPQNIESITYIDEIIDENSCPKVVNRNFSLTSTCGAVTVITQVINVTDTVLPIILESLPEDVTVECDSIPEAPVLTAEDNCSIIEVIFSENVIAGECEFQQTIERTWSATDDCNNTTSHTQIITVQDTTAPEAPVAPEDITYENVDPNTIDPVTLTAIDNCSGDIEAVSVDTIDDSDPSNIIIIRTWTFVDDCGNSSSVSQTITVIDDLSFACDGTVFYQTIQINQDIENVGSAGDFVLYLVNPSGDFSFFANLSVDDDGAGTEDEAIVNTINGIGFNTVDGLIYGVDSTADYLYRIKPNGYVENLGIVSGPISNSSNYSGTFDNDGTYYVFGSNGNLVSIDLSGEVNPGDPITSTFLYDLNIDSPDVAINPSDFKMYGWNSSTRQLFRVDLTNGNVEIIGPAANTSNYFSFGGMYFTASGQLFGYGNDTTVGTPGNSQESVVQFNLTTGEPTTIGIGIEVTANDGASCAFGFELLKDAPNTVDLGQIFTYTFTIANATNDSLNDLEFIDDLMSGLTFTSDPYNITNGMSIEGTTDGLTSANLTIGNIPTGSSTFQIDVVTDCSIEGVISNQATLSSEFLTVTSDDPQTSGVTNTTVTQITDPTINVPNPLVIEGCDISVINIESAVFPISTTMSDDVKDVFNTVTDYTTNAPQNIESITYIDTIVDENSCPIVLNRNFTLTNTCGAVSVITQVINVTDSVLPSFIESLPADVTLECGNIPEAPVLTAEDNCSDANVVFSENIVLQDCGQIVERTWTATDACGNTRIHTQTITVEDTTAPVAPDAPEDITIEGTDIEDVPSENLTALDNCSGEIEATPVDTVDESDPNMIVIIRTWTFVDNCGNSSSVSQTITLVDDPSFACDGTVFYQTIRINNNIEGVGSAGDFILYLVNPSGEFSFFANLSVDDDGAGTEDEALVDSINGIGFNTVDGLLYGVDSTDDYLYRIMPNGYVQNLGVVTGPISNSSNYSGTFDNDGTYYVLGNNGSLVSIDLSGEVNPGDPITSTFLYNLNVNSPDVAINPSDFKMYGWNSNTRQLFRVDLSTGDLEIIGPDANTSNYFSFGGLYFTASGQLFGYGNDTNVGSPGNSQESVVQFDLATGIPTTIGIGPEVTANDGASCAFGFELLKDAPATVDLGQVFTYTFTIANATNGILNDLEFIDDLMSGLVFTSDPYNITNGMSITGTTNGLTSANLTIGNIATGSSTFQIDVVTDCSIIDGIISNQATLSSEFLTVTSDDPQTAGVTNTTVTQITDPTIEIPNPLVIEGCDTSVITVENAVFPLSETMSEDIKDVFNTVDGYTATAPQNIESITYIDTIVDDNSCPIIVNRVFTLINTCGVSTEITQEINVQDTEAPTFTVPDDITIECDDDATFLSLTGDVTDEADNCTTDLEATYVDAFQETDCAGAMTILRSWTLTDDCGNETTLVQTITMQDSVAPMFTVPADVTLDCDVDVTDLSITGDVTDEADNCATTGLDAVFTDEIEQGECAGGSVITRTWTLSDGCNETTMVQTITLIDETAPTFTVPESITVECDVDITDLSVTGDVTDEADNCAADIEATYSDEVVNGDCIGESIITRTWTLSDGCNETSLDQTITVQDTTAPDLTSEYESEVTVNCAEVPEVPELTFQDNCTNDVSVTFTENSTDDGTGGDYIIIREWLVSDDCGNETLFTQTITVNTDGDSITVVEGESICIGDDFSYDLFNLLEGDVDQGGTWTTTNTDIIIDGNFFNPSQLLNLDGSANTEDVGDYTFTYTYDGACSGSVTATLNINDDCIVLPCGRDDVVISRAVTVNNDGVNETFTITGVETCGFAFEVQIFNRWGAKIYENNNYENDWGGQVSDGSIGSSGLVPTGTYYYVLNIKNSGFEPIAGPIYVSTK